MHIHRRLENVRASIRKIKEYPQNYKRPQDCIIHLSKIEMILEDRLMEMQEAKQYSYI